MRQPVARPVDPDVARVVARAVEQHEQQHEHPRVSSATRPPAEPLPTPAQSLLPRKGLREPDQRFVDDIAKCIRSGVRPLLAAQWLGVSRKTLKAWRSRHGPLYDELLKKSATLAESNSRSIAREWQPALWFREAYQRSLREPRTAPMWVKRGDAPARGDRLVPTLFLLRKDQGLHGADVRHDLLHRPTPQPRYA